MNENIIGKSFGLLNVLDPKAKPDGYFCECRRCKKIHWLELPQLSDINVVNCCGKKVEDLTGRRFGRLVVTSLCAEKSVGYWWNCLCDCGNINISPTSALKSGRTKSCGCLHQELVDKPLMEMIGKKFNRLTVLRISQRPADKFGRRYVDCLCDCGKEKTIQAGQVRNGITVSCGCLAAENARQLFTTHGASSPDHPKHFEHGVWIAAKARCNNPNHSSAYKYHDAGITFHPEWNESFEAFYEYIGPAPSKQHSLDRINPFGNYEPGNVRWATDMEQAHNKRIHYTSSHIDVEAVDASGQKYIRKIKDRTGMRFGHLIVEGLYLDSSGQSLRSGGNTAWNCLCENCGKKNVVLDCNLTRLLRTGATGCQCLPKTDSFPNIPKT